MMRLLEVARDYTYKEQAVEGKVVAGASSGVAKILEVKTARARTAKARIARARPAVVRIPAAMVAAKARIARAEIAKTARIATDYRRVRKDEQPRTARKVHCSPHKVPH
jgi:hypothetical protein